MDRPLHPSLAMYRDGPLRVHSRQAARPRHEASAPRHRATAGGGATPIVAATPSPNRHHDSPVAPSATTAPPTDLRLNMASRPDFVVETPQPTSPARRPISITPRHVRRRIDEALARDASVAAGPASSPHGSSGPAGGGQGSDSESNAAPVPLRTPQYESFLRRRAAARAAHKGLPPLGEVLAMAHAVAAVAATQRHDKIATAAQRRVLWQPTDTPQDVFDRVAADVARRQNERGGGVGSRNLCGTNPTYWDWLSTYNVFEEAKRRSGAEGGAVRPIQMRGVR